MLGMIGILFPLQVDESLLIVPNGEVAVVEISDSETEKLMPPPNEIPKKSEFCQRVCFFQNYFNVE